MKAIVTAPQGSNQILMISRKNPDSAAIMLRSEIQGINAQGFVQNEVRVGLVKGKTEDMRKIAANLKAGDNFSEKVMPVKLVVKESLEPFYSGQEPKINPQTKETVTHMGAPVYRQTIVVAEDSPETDVKLATDSSTASVTTTAIRTEYAQK